MTIDYTKAQAIIDAELPTEFAAVLVSDHPEDADPAALAASEAAIDAIEAAFNALVPDVFRTVSSAEIAGWVVQQDGLYAATRAAAEVPTNTNAVIMLGILSGNIVIDSIDLTKAIPRSFLQNLIVGLGTEVPAWDGTVRSNFISFVRHSIPRWQDEGIGEPVGRGHIMLMKEGRI